MKAEDVAIQDARMALHCLSPPGLRMPGQDDCILQFTAARTVKVFDYLRDHHGGKRIPMSIADRLQQHLIANG
eukprot:1052998-Rhodomonas_salina.1